MSDKTERQLERKILRKLTKKVIQLIEERQTRLAKSEQNIARNYEPWMQRLADEKEQQLKQLADKLTQTLEQLSNTEISLKFAKSALEPFIKDYEPWMHVSSNDERMTVHSVHTHEELCKAKIAVDLINRIEKQSQET